MDIPLVICYPLEKALAILEERGVGSIQVVRIQREKVMKEYITEERVICQRERNGNIQLIVC